MVFFNLIIVHMIVRIRKRLVGLLILTWDRDYCFSFACLVEFTVHLQTFCFHGPDLLYLPLDALLLFSFFLVSVYCIDF